MIFRPELAEMVIDGRKTAYDPEAGVWRIGLKAAQLLGLPSGDGEQ